MFPVAAVEVGKKGQGFRLTRDRGVYVTKGGGPSLLAAWGAPATIAH